MNIKIKKIMAWLEIRGIEAEVIYDDETIVCLDDNDDTFIFCYLNDISLNHVIDEHDMYNTFYSN